MRTLTFVLAVLLTSSLLPMRVQAADGASVHAILITASKEKAPADARLAAYEATLQRNLPESSFRYAGEGTATVSGKAKVSISLGSAHQVILEGGSRDADGILLKVRWLSGTKVIMNNSFTFQPGVPIVLGQRPGGNGDLPIVILIAK